MPHILVGPWFQDGWRRGHLGWMLHRLWHIGLRLQGLGAGRQGWYCRGWRWGHLFLHLLKQRPPMGV